MTNRGRRDGRHVADVLKVAAGDNLFEGACKKCAMSCSRSRP
jgi:hypothetical protein